MIAVNQHPDHDTIADFRRRHLMELSGLFVQVLRMCQKAGLVKLGHAALDGTKVRANAQRLKRGRIDGYIAPQKEKHSRQQAPPRGRIPKSATVKERMARKLKTVKGRCIYALRKQIVEPVIGQIKEARGFRRFSFRGLRPVQGEWDLICLTHNILKLFRSGFTFAPA